MLADSDPDIARAAQRRDIFDNIKFPDLRSKPIWLEKMEASSASDLLLKHAEGSVEYIAFGEPDSGGEGGSVDVTGVHQARIPLNQRKLPRFVRLAIEQASEEAQPEKQTPVAVLVSPAGYTEPVFPLPMLVDEDGVIDPVTVFTKSNGRTRQRRACFIRLEKRTGEFIRHIIAVEGPTFGGLPTVAKLPGVDITAVVKVLYQGDRNASLSPV